jgi:DNA-binding NtrC family response regulator
VRAKDGSAHSPHSRPLDYLDDCSLSPASLGGAGLAANALGRCSDTTVMPPRVPTICVVEDDPDIASLVGRIAAKTGMRVLVSTSSEEALALVDAELTHLVIADVNMPELTGPELIRELRAKGVTCPVLFISGDASIVTLDSSLRIERASFLPKPFTATELELAIWAALVQR